MTEHTVDAELAPVEWGDNNRLVDLMEALGARPELLGPVVGADLTRRAVGITVTVVADSPAAAQDIAKRALEEEPEGRRFESWPRYPREARESDFCWLDRCAPEAGNPPQHHAGPRERSRVGTLGRRHPKSWGAVVARRGEALSGPRAAGRSAVVAALPAAEPG